MALLRKRLSNGGGGAAPPSVALRIITWRLPLHFQHTPHAGGFLHAPTLPRQSRQDSLGWTCRMQQIMPMECRGSRRAIMLTRLGPPLY